MLDNPYDTNLMFAFKDPRVWAQLKNTTAQTKHLCMWKYYIFIFLCSKPCTWMPFSSGDILDCTIWGPEAYSVVMWSVWLYNTSSQMFTAVSGLCRSACRHMLKMNQRVPSSAKCYNDVLRNAWWCIRNI